MLLVDIGTHTYSSRRCPCVGQRRCALKIDRLARDNIVLILVVVLAYSAGCGGSSVDVDSDVRVNVCVVVLPPPSSLVTIFLLSPPLPSPHHMPLTNFLIVVSVGSSADVNPKVGVDACVVVSLPPSSLVTVVLLSSPLPIPH